MARKTVSVEFVKAKVNIFLASSEVDWTAQRTGALAVLEAVLFETDNYKGFRFLASEKDDAGNLIPGADTTRREYF